jgi:hypothetical protein
VFSWCRDFIERGGTTAGGSNSTLCARRAVKEELAAVAGLKKFPANPENPANIDP